MELYIVNRKTLLRLEIDELLQEGGNPIPECIVDFVDSDLPIGMSPFVLGSKCYFAGGLMLAKHHSATFDGPYLDLSYKEGNDWIDMSRKVIVFEPSPSSFSVPFKQDHHDIPSMNEPKAYPFIVTVEGKIYILGCYPYLSKYKNPAYPEPFECYDPVTRKWEVLPEPPCFKADLSTYEIRHLFVSGNKIYVTIPQDIFIYDVHKRKWFTTYDLRIHRNLLSTWMYWVSFAQGHQGIAIAYERYQGLVVYQYADENDPANTLERYQYLDIVNYGERLYIHTGFVRHLGFNRFLVVYTTPEKTKFERPVHVTIFVVNIAPIDSPPEEFFEVKLLSTHTYDFGKFSNWDMEHIQDVIILNKVFKKGKFDEVHI